MYNICIYDFYSFTYKIIKLKIRVTKIVKKAIENPTRSTNSHRKFKGEMEPIIHPNNWKP